MDTVGNRDMMRHVVAEATVVPLVCATIMGNYSYSICALVSYVGFENITVVTARNATRRCCCNDIACLPVSNVWSPGTLVTYLFCRMRYVHCVCSCRLLVAL